MEPRSGAVHGPPMREWGGLLCLLGGLGCDVGFERPAPSSPPARGPGRCEQTASLAPRLLQALDDDDLAPWREVVHSRFEGPEARPALRELIGAFLDVARRLGLEPARDLASSLLRPELGARLEPGAVALFETLDGRLDGMRRYEVLGAAGSFIRTCEPEPLLGALQVALRLERADGQRWARDVLVGLRQLLELDEVATLSASFRLDGEVGRPAVVELLTRVMLVLGRDPDPMPALRTLIDSAVRPLLSAEAEAVVDRLIRLGEEASASSAWTTLGAAFRCGNRRPEARDQLLGFVVDLAVVPELGAEGWLKSAEALETLSDVELDGWAGVLEVFAESPGPRDTLLEGLAVLLEPDVAPRWAPVLLGLMEDGVLREVTEGLVALLDGCAS